MRLLNCAQVAARAFVRLLERLKLLPAEQLLVEQLVFAADGTSKGAWHEGRLVASEVLATKSRRGEAQTRYQVRLSNGEIFDARHVHKQPEPPLFQPGDESHHCRIMRWPERLGSAPCTFSGPDV